MRANVMLAASSSPVITADHLDTLEPQQMRAALLSLMGELAERDGVIARQARRRSSNRRRSTSSRTRTLLKRMKFAAQSGASAPSRRACSMNRWMRTWPAVADEIEQATPPVAGRQDKTSPQTRTLPAHLSRREIRHEPGVHHLRLRLPDEAHRRGRGREAGLRPGVFTVERHIRGKWACAQCETIHQVPVDPHIIDKGIPTTGLLAQCWWPSTPTTCRCTARKRSSAAPSQPSPLHAGAMGGLLWRAVAATGRRHEDRAAAAPRAACRRDAGVPCSKPGNGKGHRAYLGPTATGAFENTKAVVYDFCESRSGEHARRFLEDWRGSLTCDDFSGYKALIASGVTEVGCLAHARRKFFDLHAANQSQIAEVALQQFARVYEIEREVKEIATDQRQTIRQQQTKPLLDALHQWMVLQRQKVPEGSASAKALDYSLRRWEALTRSSMTDSCPWTTTGSRTRFGRLPLAATTGSLRAALRAGQRAAAVSDAHPVSTTQWA